MRAQIGHAVDGEPLVEAGGVLGVLARQHAEFLAVLEFYPADRALLAEDDAGVGAWARTAAVSSTTPPSAWIASSDAPRLTVPTVAAVLVRTATG